MAFNLDMHKKIEIRMFSGNDGLRALEDAWRVLERRVPDLRFIHHYGWYRSYLESFEHGAGTVVFLLMSESGNPVAIFPLHRTVIQRFGVPLRTWEILWQNDMGIRDFVFAKTEDNRHLLAVLSRFLRENEDLSWDLLSLKDTLDDSCAQYSLRASPLPLSVTIKHHYSKYIHCNSNYESVMSRLSGDFRRNLRRQTKKLSELGDIEYRFVTDAQEMEDAFNHFLHAEASSWKGDTGTKSAIQLHQDSIRFYRTLVNEFSKYGACSINLILLNGQCIASQLCLIIENTLYLLKIGYNDEYKAIGLGNVLLNELIQRCCVDNKIKKISFVTGATWNDRWSPESIDVYESYIFNSTLSGIAVYVMEMVKNHGRQVKHRCQFLFEKYSKPGTT